MIVLREGAGDPGITHDNSSGYFKRAMYLNTTDDSVWMCLDAAVGAAVWAHIGTAARGPNTWSSMSGSASTSDATTGVTTGIAFAVESGKKYRFTGMLGVSTGSAGVGLQTAWKATGGATATAFLHAQRNASTTTTDAVGYSSALGTFTSNSSALTSEGPCVLDTYLDCSASGTVTLWIKSEGGAVTVTAHRGSVQLEEIG